MGHTYDKDNTSRRYSKSNIRLCSLSDLKIPHNQLIKYARDEKRTVFKEIGKSTGQPRAPT